MPLAGAEPEDCIARILDAHPTPAGTEFYVAGPDALLTPLKAALLARGLDERAWHGELIL